MRKIVPELTDELLKHFVDANKVASAKPFKVNSFRELVEHTAKLSFKNKDHLLFYRGQHSDYINKAGSSSFYPSIYRGDYLPAKELAIRFDILDGVCESLVQLFESDKIEGYTELKKRKSVQWSIIQHYGVYETPLLDFTHSLRVACSFALLDNKNEFGYVYIFGLPYITNRVSVNSEQEIVNVRLLSICPPTALRPYFQEGYLAGTEEVTTNFDSKSELDFNNRLVVKFKIPNRKDFWGKGLEEISKDFLYPSEDPIYEVCLKIKDLAVKQLKTGDLGEFLESWVKLEQELLSSARIITNRNVSIREAIAIAKQHSNFNNNELNQIDALRIFRNKLVHSPQKVIPGELLDYSTILDRLLKRIK